MCPVIQEKGLGTSLNPFLYYSSLASFVLAEASRLYNAGLQPYHICVECPFHASSASIASPPACCSAVMRLLQRAQHLIVHFSLFHCSQPHSSLPTISRRDNTKVASHKGKARNGWIRPTRTKPAVGRQHLRAWLYSSLRDAVRPLRCPAITLRSWLAIIV